MKLLTRTAASTALVASVFAGALTFSAGTATAAAGSEIEGLSCGFDNRTPPPTVQVGSTGHTVKEAKCLLMFWTGLQKTEEEPEGVFGPNAEDATKAFQERRGLPPTGVVDARTWAELRHS